MVEWAQEHAEMILEAWGEELPRLPSEATLRSGILALIRTQTWPCIPQALRHYAAHPREALEAFGLPFS